MYVVDASVVLDLLLNRPSAARLRWLLFSPRAKLHAPHLIDAEVLHVLRRLMRIAAIEEGRAQEALDAYRILPIERHGHESLLAAAWGLRFNFTAYDAIYVTLAHAVGGTFVTMDIRLAKAASSFVRVETV